MRVAGSGAVEIYFRGEAARTGVVDNLYAAACAWTGAVRYARSGCRFGVGQKFC